MKLNTKHISAAAKLHVLEVQNFLRTGGRINLTPNEVLDRIVRSNEILSCTLGVDAMWFAYALERLIESGGDSIVSEFVETLGNLTGCWTTGNQVVLPSAPTDEKAVK